MNKSKKTSKLKLAIDVIKTMQSYQVNNIKIVEHLNENTPRFKVLQMIGSTGAFYETEIVQMIESMGLSQYLYYDDEHKGVVLSVF